MSEKTVEPGKNGDKEAPSPVIRFLSLRWKLLIGMTIPMMVILSVTFIWFFTTAEDLALKRIQDDLGPTLIGAAEGVDVAELMALAETGVPNEEGFSDDPRFISQMDWLDQVRDIEERAIPYLYVKGTEENQVFFVVDLYARHDPGSAAGFMESYTSTGFLVKGLDEFTYRLSDHRVVAPVNDFADWLEEKSAPSGMVTAVTNFANWLAEFFPKRFGTYGDKFGRWVSGYMPLVDNSGVNVGGIGIDFEADYVDEVRDSIRGQIFTALFVTLAVLLPLIFIFAQVFTRPILALTAAAGHIAEGNYDVDFKELGTKGRQDEIDRLTAVFDTMVQKVYKREQSLKKQVASLKIEIDQAKQETEVEEIVDTDFFRELQSRANKLRSDRSDGKTKN